MTKQIANLAVSTAVIEAQARLMELRAALKLRRSKQGNSAATLPDRFGEQSTKQHRNQPSDCNTASIPNICLMPTHLGWGSKQLTQMLRRSIKHQRQRFQESSLESGWLPTLKPPAPENKQAAPALNFTATPESISARMHHVRLSSRDIGHETVKLHPDIGLGILRNKMAASGRIWLLLRWINSSGSGQVEIEVLRKLLCDRQSAIYVCGWRQMRTLLSQGKEYFWSQGNGKIWLYSTPKVAHALGTERLSGHPVALPVKCLIQGIGQVRAHLFASFHSGRKQATPISRSSLAKISQVSARSQQNYEDRSHVRKLKNYAVGTKLSSDEAKEQAWQHRSACFNWHDRKAEHGQRNNAFLAWQLPNSYLGPHEQRPLGRQKRFNRELADLFAIGMTGNDLSAVEFTPKRYFDGPKKAAYMHNKTHGGVYWRGKHPGLWYYMASSDC